MMRWLRPASAREPRESVMSALSLAHYRYAPGFRSPGRCSTLRTSHDRAMPGRRHRRASYRPVVMNRQIDREYLGNVLEMALGSWQSTSVRAFRPANEGGRHWPMNSAPLELHIRARMAREPEATMKAVTRRSFRQPGASRIRCSNIQRNSVLIVARAAETSSVDCSRER
jgi:hypothetical protein